MIVFSLPNSEQKLVLSNVVIQHFDKYRQRSAGDVEAGGQLFARIEGATVFVDLATGPRRQDLRTRFGFQPNRRQERKEIATMFKKGLHYIGDWHTHPEEYPVPSGRDIASMVETFHRSRHQLAGFVMMIVGISCDADGLYVAVCNESDVVRLR